MSRPLSVAVIGAGWWATAAHLPALVADSRVVRLALCDLQPERLEAAATAFEIERTYTDHQALLETERPDAVIIATTHASHYGLAKDCLDAGVHTLVEKPLTLHAREARALVESAQQHSCALLLGYPTNYAPLVCRLREIVRAGRLGTVQFVNALFHSYCLPLYRGDDSHHRGYSSVHGPGDVYSKKEHSGGGHGHLQMTHVAGLLFAVTGLRIQTVRAQMANHGLPLDLVDAMLVTFEGGGLGLIGGSSNAFQSRMDLQVYGETGSLVLNMRAGTATLGYADGTREEIGPLEDTTSRDAPVRHLVSIASGEEPVTIAEEGWRAVELLEAAYRSADADGRSVSLSELYETVDGGQLPHIMGGTSAR